MTKDDDKYTRHGPPDDHEWPDIWRGIERAHKSWVITGPIYAAVTNWRAWLIILVIVGWINQPDIAAMTQRLTAIAKAVLPK